MKKLQILFLISFVFLLASCQKELVILPIAENGELRLTQEDFIKNDMIALDGEWKFFWKELLTENEIKNRINNNSLPNIYVPSSWEQSLGTSYGFGTYYLKIIIPEEKVGNTLALLTSHQYSSYTLLVDGARVASNGYVGSTKETSEPGSSNRLVYFTPRDKEINIVLHVSNFVHSTGGAYNPIYIGSAEKVDSSFSDTLVYMMLFIGAILAMGIYEIFIFFFRRKDREFLYFGLLCIAVTLYSLLQPPFYLQKVIPSIPWIWQDRFGIIIIYVIFMLSLFYIRMLYPKEMKKLPFILGIIIPTITIIITLFTEPSIYILVLKVFFLVVLLFMMNTIYVLFLAFKRKKSNAAINLISNLLFFGSVINDVLLLFNVIHTVPLTTYGFFFYILIQSFTLSKDYARKLDESELLALELQELNISLDEKIKARTEELNVKNNELKRLTQIDGLTGLYNRRYFDEQLLLEFTYASSIKRPLSLLMMDIDYFKKYNDQFGHLAGDELLKSFSRLVNDICLSKGFMARYGGEEFVVVLPNMSLNEAVEFAEELRFLVEEQKYPTVSEVKYVTISIGVSSTENHAFNEKDELIEQADKALYESKKNGRNRTSVL